MVKSVHFYIPVSPSLRLVLDHTFHDHLLVPCSPKLESTSVESRPDHQLGNHHQGTLPLTITTGGCDHMGPIDFLFRVAGPINWVALDIIDFQRVFRD